MGIVAWLVLGTLAGGIASLVTGHRNSGCVSRLVVGVLGALICGALARAAGVRGVTELSVRAVVVASLGAVLLLLVLQAVEGRRRGHHRATD